jgi:hypothetical protein
MLDSRMVPDHISPVVHVGYLSLVLTRMKHAPTPGRSLDDQRQIGPSVTRVTSFFLPHDSLVVGERGFGQVVTQLHQLTGPITPACDRYVQCLLTGANLSVLNRHRRGLKPCRCRLANSTPRPSQPTILHFPPNGPTRSQVIHPNFMN